MKVDMPTKEARFTVKKDSKCDVEAVKKVVKDAGYTVSAVKEPKAAKSKAGDAKTPASGS